MTSRKRPVVLSPKAKEDQQSILLHGITTWGESQAAGYEAALDRALEHLGSYPEIGRRRDDIAPGLRCFPVERHLILDRVETNAVRVDRILHGRRDLWAVFPRRRS